MLLSLIWLRLRRQIIRPTRLCVSWTIKSIRVWKVPANGQQSAGGFAFISSHNHDGSVVTERSNGLETRRWPTSQLCGSYSGREPRISAAAKVATQR